MAELFLIVYALVFMLVLVWLPFVIVRGIFRSFHK